MEIEFPNLEYLHLSGNDESTASTIAAWRRSSFPWKLRFPKLKELVMYRTGSAIPLLECAALPSHMDMIRIHATESVLRYVSGLTLPDANELRVGTDHRDPEEADDAAEGAGAEVPAVIAAACRILERAQRAEELVLNIEGNWPRVQPEHITATSITQLIISPVTRVEVMLGMLQRLPCLSYIHFWHLNAEVVEADLSLPGPDEDCAIEPLHTAITTISMHATGYHSSQENSADVAKYLLLKIPTLTGLYAKLTVEAPVMEFVKAYSKRYPRLLNVDLVLAKEGSW
ncbi:hypothetical protein H4R18_004380 [Coemansia javaensis]|uniref:Uncharacterized protein n=1 Tax=Coemansia javaensis TaxID=2761396 RepID=A0A9W8LH69_9FUNG|nr:hypothetical protein H4R18_004380 [Coemansia javaensis]